MIMLDNSSRAIHSEALLSKESYFSEASNKKHFNLISVSALAMKIRTKLDENVSYLMLN